MTRSNDVREILEGATNTMKRTTTFLDSLSKATCPNSEDGSEISDKELSELMECCDKMLVSGTMLRHRLSLVDKSRRVKDLVDFAAKVASKC